MASDSAGDGGTTNAAIDIQKRIRDRGRTTAETILWAILAFSPAIYVAISWVFSRTDFLDSPSAYLEWLWLSAFAIVVPLLLWLAFRRLPIRLLFEYLASSGESIGAALASLVLATLQNTALGGVVGSLIDANLGLKPSAARSIVQVSEEKLIIDPRKLLLQYAISSNNLAKEVYNRATIYLVAGALIALGGLGFFYFYHTLHPPSTETVPAYVVSLVPGFGILFFIEFVALFFLRQHRAAMDDFRYYDSVRRQREESVVVLAMFAENTDVVATADVLKAMRIYSGDQKLAAGETTEILESRRLQRDDIIVIEKLFEAFGTMRASSDKKKGDGKSKKKADDD